MSSPTNCPSPSLKTPFSSPQSKSTLNLKKKKGKMSEKIKKLKFINTYTVTNNGHMRLKFLITNALCIVGTCSPS